MQTEICRHYTQGRCRFGDRCRFIHPTEIIPTGLLPEPILKPETSHRHTKHPNEKRENKRPQSSEEYQFRPANKAHIQKSDEYQSRPVNRRHHRLIKRNTESFEPNNTPADMRILFETASGKTTTSLQFQTRDVAIVSNLFCDVNNTEIYHSLLNEIQHCGLAEDELWKLWHGDSHLIADDRARLDYKAKSPTFQKIIQIIQDYFKMDVKATRLNWYRDNQDWKPFHHDASAVDPKKAEIQNFTVGVSFGCTRSVEFEDALNNVGHRRRINVELPNGTLYAFSRDINTNWRHGIPQTTEMSPMGRISIICWGHVEQQNV